MEPDRGNARAVHRGSRGRPLEPVDRLCVRRRELRALWRHLQEHGCGAELDSREIPGSKRLLPGDRPHADDHDLCVLGVRRDPQPRRGNLLDQRGVGRLRVLDRDRPAQPQSLRRDPRRPRLRQRGFRLESSPVWAECSGVLVRLGNGDRAVLPDGAFGGDSKRAPPQHQRREQLDGREHRRPRLDPFRGGGSCDTPNRLRRRRRRRVPEHGRRSELDAGGPRESDRLRPGRTGDRRDRLRRGDRNFEQPGRRSHVGAARASDSTRRRIPSSRRWSPRLPTRPCFWQEACLDSSTRAATPARAGVDPASSW